MWSQVWKNEFGKLNFSTKDLLDDFIRQDIVVALANETCVAGALLYSFLNIDSIACRQHRYMSNNYPDHFFQILKARGVKTIMSWEYLTVSPQWRKANIGGVSLGRILLALSSKLLKESHADCSISPARNDVKTSQMVYEVGGEPILQNISNHNVNCDLVACFKNNVQDHPDLIVRKYANHYWQNRTYDWQIPQINKNVVRSLQKAS